MDGVGAFKNATEDNRGEKCVMVWEGETEERKRRRERGEDKGENWMKLR